MVKTKTFVAYLKTVSGKKYFVVINPSTKKYALNETEFSPFFMYNSPHASYSGKYAKKTDRSSSRKTNNKQAQSHVNKIIKYAVALGKAHLNEEFEVVFSRLNSKNCEIKVDWNSEAKKLSRSTPQSYLRYQVL